MQEKWFERGHRPQVIFAVCCTSCILILHVARTHFFPFLTTFAHWPRPGQAVVENMRKAIFLWTHKNNTEGMLMLIIWALNWTSVCFNRSTIRWSDSIWPSKLQGQNLGSLDPATSVTFQVQQSCPFCTGVQIYSHIYFCILWQL